MFVACGIWCLADVSSVLAHAEKQFFFKTSLRVLINLNLLSSTVTTNPAETL